MEHLLSALTKWCLRKNIAASKNENLPIIFIKDTAHCSWVEFDLRRSKKSYSIDIFSCTIYYDMDIIKTKQRIRNLMKNYIKTKKEYATYKFQPIHKACTDLIDNQNIYLNKITKVVIKSITSKTEVIDYDNNTHLISNLFHRYV